MSQSFSPVPGVQRGAVSTLQLARFESRTAGATKTLSPASSTGNDLYLKLETRERLPHPAKQLFDLLIYQNLSLVVKY